MEGCTDTDYYQLTDKRLLDDNRMDDLMRSMDDPIYQEQMMREYGIL